MYKITCKDVTFLRSKNYRNAEFKAVAYTDDEEIANDFRNNSLTSGGEPLFEVEEAE